LNTNKEIIALESGRFLEESKEELLFIGSKTNILAYDVHSNADLFDYEVADGLNCLKCCSIQG
jgi:Bardet-Biedl syndrome 2 protein